MRALIERANFHSRSSSSQASRSAQSSGSRWPSFKWISTGCSFRQVQVAVGRARLRLRRQNAGGRGNIFDAMPGNQRDVLLSHRGDCDIHGPGFHVPGQFVQPRKGAEQHSVDRSFYQRRRKRGKHFNHAGPRVGQHFHDDRGNSAMRIRHRRRHKDRANTAARC